MSEYLFEMRKIVKDFPGARVLNGIDIAVRAGECVGLCGENGAGKSTLMKVLSGVYPYGAWEGEVLWQGKPLRAHSIRDSERAGIVIIHQELMMVPKISVTENIFLGNEIRSAAGRMNYGAMHRRARELLAKLRLADVDVTAPVMNYGGGHQQLFEIAKALQKNAKLLILDEPTSSLTVPETEVLLSIVKDLKRQGVACVYISHKLEEIAKICDTVTVIRDGTHVGTRPMAELDTNRIIAMMVGRELTNLYPAKTNVPEMVIFEARSYTCWDVTNPLRKRVDDISFEVRRGEILGIAGLAGAGRTELVSAIFSAYPGRYVGQSFLHGKPVNASSPAEAIRHGISMVPEDRKRQGIVPLLSVGDNITLATLNKYSRLGHVNKSEELKTIVAEIKRLRVKTASPALAIVALSGGNQQKAVLTRMQLPGPEVLILDEPTRGVDVGAKYDIYQLMIELASNGLAIIMVSSDLPEVLGVSDRVLVIGEGRLCGNFVNHGLTQEMIMGAALSGQQKTKHAA
ncbi:MAG: xylose ABC transporter ATP-binding protein [Burkholderiales bacterium]